VIQARPHAQQKVGALGVQPDFLFRIRLNLALAGHVRPQLNGAVLVGRHKLIKHCLRLRAKGALQQMPADVGHAQAAVVEPTQAALNLVAVQRQGRREVPQKTLNRIGGHFPDAEKAQNVVDTQHVEVAR